MGEIINHFDEDEMRSFGLNPDSPEDMYDWLQTEPADAAKPADHGMDAFVYGSVPAAEARNFMSQDQMRRLGASTFHQLEKRPFTPNTRRESGGH